MIRCHGNGPPWLAAGPAVGQPTHWVSKLLKPEEPLGSIPPDPGTAQAVTATALPQPPFFVAPSHGRRLQVSGFPSLPPARASCAGRRTQKKSQWSPGPGATGASSRQLRRVRSLRAPKRMSPSQGCYTEIFGFRDFVSETKPNLLSHLEQDSALRTTLLPKVIQALWSHIYLLINYVTAIAKPPSSLSSSNVVCKMAGPFIALCPQRLSCRSHFLFTSKKKKAQFSKDGQGCSQQGAVCRCGRVIHPPVGSPGPRSSQHPLPTGYLHPPAPGASPGPGNSKHTQIKSQINPVWPHPLSQQRVWIASMSLFPFLPEEVVLKRNSL